MKSILLLIIFSFAFAQAEDNSVLCSNEAMKQISFSKQIIPRPRDPSEITLISWNAHKLADKQFFYDLQNLSHQADILMVQEAVHTTNWQNAFQGYMPFAFNFYKSFCWNDNANGVLTGARFNLENNVPLLSPGTEPGSFTHKVSGYSQIRINNQVVHLMNTHALNFNVGISFEDQIDQIVTFLAQVKGPIIWAGDFNTWNPLRSDYLNKQTAKIGLTHIIPLADDRFLTLDHVYARGFVAAKTEVLDFKSSDHVPMKTTLRLN